MKAKKILASVVACLVLILSMTAMAAAEGTATALPAADNGVITLTEDVTLAEKVVVNEDIILDLNGKTLTLPALDNYAIVVKGTLTIKDSAENGTLITTGAYGIGTSTTCTGGINIEGGRFSSTYWDDEFGGGYMLGVFGGDVTISGGTFSTLGTVVNCFDGYNGTVEITDGSFASTGTNYWSDPFLGVNISVEGGTFSEAIPSEYLADGQLTSKNADGAYEIVTAEAKVTASAGEGFPVYKYASFKEAMDSVKEWDTVTLLDDATLTEKVVVDKEIYIDGNSYKITTSNQKLFEVFANFEVSNLKMESTHTAGRCVDTRVDNITVSIDNCELVAKGSGWAQPLTIGGTAEGGLTVNVTDSKIESSYVATIIFVPVELTIDGSELTGYGAVYTNGTSGNATGSVITITDSDLKTKNTHSGESDNFAAIVLQDDGITLTVDAASTIAVEATNNAKQAAISLSNKTSAATIECPVTTTGENATVLMNIDKGSLTVTNEDVKAAVEAEGYNIAADGKVSVPAASWTTDTDAGFYLEEETKYGMLRFLFSAEIDGEITESGIKYIKVSNIADKDTVDGVIADANGASAFYGDINGIPETEAGKSIAAVAYVKTAVGTYWSDAVVGTVDMTNQQFTDYVAGGAQ